MSDFIVSTDVLSNNPLDAIPEVDFVPKTLDQIITEMTKDYEEEYFRQTGEKKVIVPASEERIFIYTEALRFYTGYQYIDRAAKMNLLKYSSGAYLDNLGALYGLERLPAQKAVDRARFTLSAAQRNSVLIPQGTRITTPTKVMFQTKADITIPAGELTGESDIEACKAGVDGNGFIEGQINVIVDPVPYVAKVTNLEGTQGGADIEDDGNLRLRIYYYPRSYSVAGPELAYSYFITSFSQVIEGISVFSPTPGVVDIRITLQGGQLPTDAFINSIMEHLEDKRPLTDNVYIGSPDLVKYEISGVYYIARSKRGQQSAITEQVDANLQRYIEWQGTVIGRDLIPDMLAALIVSAGAKRVDLTSPKFEQVGHDSICQLKAADLQFGGIEDD